MAATAVVAVLLAALGVALATPARAVTDGKITVTNPQNGQTYKLYKLFDATTDTSRQQSSPENNAAGIAYNYTVSGSKSLETAYSYTDSNGQSQSVKGSDFFAIDAAGNVTAKDADVTNATLTTLAFQTWAENFGTQVGEAKIATGETTSLEFTGLSDGYYFLTSSMGSLITVTSVAPNQEVTDKNTAPDVVKSENVATSNVGDTVTYTLEISLPKGSSNVVFHDRIDDALDLCEKNDSSVKLTVGSAEGTALDSGNYSINYWSDTKSTTDSTQGQVNTKGDNITISFASTYLNSLESQTTVYLTYTATVKSTAGINAANEAFVTYGDSSTESTHKKVYESTFEFRVNKLDGSNGNAPLSGAKFVLSKKSNLGNLVEDENAENSYTKHKTDLLAFNAQSGVYESGGTNYLLTANNSITFAGLDNGTNNTTTTYYLYEVTAPNGYGKLTEPIAIEIIPTFSNSNLYQGTEVTGYTVRYKSLSAADTAWANAVSGQGNAIQASDLTTVRNINITNTEGAQLPSTGGIGTTVFYVVGGLMVAGAVALVVMRRRNGQVGQSTKS